MRKYYLVIAFAGLGCSFKHEQNDSSSNSKLSYDFTENGCATGKHEFGSAAELCEGLRNEELNRGCAFGSRVDYARAQKCPRKE